MTTLERINTLLVAIHLPPVRSLYGLPQGNSMEGSVHQLLNTIDSHVGIITRKQFGGLMLAPVGERVRRLERHIQAKKAPPYFWLGADAEATMEAAPA